MFSVWLKVFQNLHKSKVNWKYSVCRSLRSFVFQRGAFVCEPAILVRRKHRGSQVWSMEKFENKIIDMRDMYDDRKTQGIPLRVDDSDESESVCVLCFACYLKLQLLLWVNLGQAQSYEQAHKQGERDVGNKLFVVCCSYWYIRESQSLLFLLSLWSKIELES